MLYIFFFFNDTATTEIYTLSLHDALPTWRRSCAITSGFARTRPRFPPRACASPTPATPSRESWDATCVVPASGSQSPKHGAAARRVVVVALHGFFQLLVRKLHATDELDPLEPIVAIAGLSLHGGPPFRHDLSSMH